MHADSGLVVSRRGLMLVLSSPSGAGKSTISREILANDTELVMSVSATTRPPRPGEVEGQHYYFVEIPQFETMVANDQFLEYAKVFDNYYGTPRPPVEAALASGKDVLFDVDWQGTQQLAQAARFDLVSIFILPPSIPELESRLRKRAQDPDDVIQRRMKKAADEISHWREYDYIIINDDLERSIGDVKSILRAERLKRDRRTGLVPFVKGLRGDD